MSEETKKTETETETTKKKFTVRELIWLLIGVIAGIIIGWGVFTATLTSSVNKITSQNPTTVESSVDTTESAK